MGNPVLSTDRNGNVTTWIYDAINRRISLTDALGNTTQWQYDPVGNLTKLTDADSHATQYAYDAVNRQITETFADGTVRSYTYDFVGNVLTRTDQIGQVTHYTYSDLYFLLSRTYPSAVNDTFTYDLSGRMLTGQRGSWPVTFMYDGADRVLQTVQNTGTIDYSYNIPGRTRTLTYPGGRVITEHTDARTRMDHIDDASSPPSIVQYVYDSGNRVTSRAYRNGTTAKFTYNADNWILNLQHSAGATPVAGFSYAYDNEGNKKYEQKLQDATHSEAYQYDKTYRLITYQVGTLVGSTVPVPSTQTSYNLDPVGNWNSKTTNAVTQTRVHNSTNELTEINSTALTYDANGNVLTDGSYTYAYDEENRLTQFTRDSDSAIVGQYQYDALSRRVQKIADPAGISVTTRYFYDNARIIEEQDGGGAAQATYVYGNYIDEILTMSRGGQTYYYHQDALWSAEAVTDSTAARVERYAYDAYGAVTVTTGAGAAVPQNAWGTPHSAIGNPWTFTGRQLDEEAGLYFYRARYYDAVLGRFLQRDPLGYVTGPNLYEYVGDNPTNWVDPSGLEAITGRGKYRCCDTAENNETKTVTVGGLVLAGSNGVGNDVTRANEIYRQCCVVIRLDGVTTWGDRLSKAAIDRGARPGILDDLILEGYDNDKTSASNSTPGERALLAFRHNCGDCITAYWVKGFSDGSRGEAFWPATQGGNGSVMVANNKAQDSFAHELGHVLLDDGGHVAGDANNLMASGGGANARDVSGNAGTDQLTEAQCDKIRMGKFAK